MSNIDIEMLRRQLDRIEASAGEEASERRGGSSAPPGPPTSDAEWRATVDTRLAQVDGALGGLKASVDSTRWIIGILVATIYPPVILGYSFFGLQLVRLEGQVDRVAGAITELPSTLSGEFHAMRSEMAAQTSAIANSITATRQAQPPQVIVVPAPGSVEKRSQK